MIKKGEVVHIDQLVRECGWFQGGTEANNGYGCSHPCQEERDGETNQGCCFAFSCPLAWRLHPDQEEEDAKLMKEQGLDPEDDDGSYLCLMTDLPDPEKPHDWIPVPLGISYRVMVSQYEVCVGDLTAKGDVLGDVVMELLTKFQRKPEEAK